MSAVQFNLLTLLGLRESHSLLDVGCGSLRAGRLLVAYLLPGRYFGIEPEQWLIEEGIENEVGDDLIRLKKPLFSNDDNFTLSVFGRKFDFILAQSIFSHTSQAQIARCLSEARKVMKPASIFAATFNEGEHNYEGDSWGCHGSVRYRREHMVDLIEREGLTSRVLNWPHPSGKTWMAIVRPEGEENIPALSDEHGLAATLLYAESAHALAKAKLSALEQRPYVRVGRVLDRLLERITRRKR